MTENEALELIRGGESITVEFKKSTSEITKDVYDTVCSFSNRDGGHIFLGVKDNGTVLGIMPDAIDRMKKDFITTVNNADTMEKSLTEAMRQIWILPIIQMLFTTCIPESRTLFM